MNRMKQLKVGMKQLINFMKKIKIFIAELEPHSDREEDILFEMMVKYVGREGGPLQ
ncbi:hypothetical protein H1D32_08905 [Anaerobacillus sp. CMMVII]|nr:hypothetical protein [Anaerobacillus sp. CMMVII]